MNNQFEKNQQNQSDKKENLNQNPQAKQGQNPGEKSVVTGTSGQGDKKQPQTPGQSNQPTDQKQAGFSQYGEAGQQKQGDVKGESQSSSRSESIGYQAGVNTPGRDQKQDPQAQQQATTPGREREVPATPGKEGQDLEHLKNPDRTTAPERKEIDPVASNKRESQQDISKNPQGRDQQQNPIV